MRKSHMIGDEVGAYVYKDRTRDGDEELGIMPELYVFEPRQTLRELPEYMYTNHESIHMELGHLRSPNFNHQIRGWEDTSEWMSRYLHKDGLRNETHDIGEWSKPVPKQTYFIEHPTLMQKPIDQSGLDEFYHYSYPLNFPGLLTDTKSNKETQLVEFEFDAARQLKAQQRNYWHIPHPADRNLEWLANHQEN